MTEANAHIRLASGVTTNSNPRDRPSEGEDEKRQFSVNPVVILAG
jgi:hypothetical protein